MIPKYRHMQYTDDGCDRYQCLSCYDTMEVRSVSFNFCPSCGIKFDGQLECRKTYIPRWLYDLNLDEDRTYELQHKIWKTVKTGWVLKKRTVWWNKREDVKYYRREEHSGAADWSTYRTFTNTTAKQMFEYLKGYREQSDRAQDDDLDFCWDFCSYDEFKVERIPNEQRV